MESELVKVLGRDHNSVSVHNEEDRLAYYRENYKVQYNGNKGYSECIGIWRVIGTSTPDAN